MFSVILPLVITAVGRYYWLSANFFHPVIFLKSFFGFNGFSVYSLWFLHKLPNYLETMAMLSFLFHTVYHPTFPGRSVIHRTIGTIPRACVFFQTLNVILVNFLVHFLWVLERYLLSGKGISCLFPMSLYHKKMPKIFKWLSCMNEKVCNFFFH